MARGAVSLSVGIVPLNPVDTGYCVLASGGDHRDTMVSPNSFGRTLGGTMGSLGVGCVLLARKRFSRVLKIDNLGRFAKTGILVRGLSNSYLSSRGGDLYS